MANIDYNNFESLMDAADNLPYDAERIALREKAMNLADLAGDEANQFQARLKFVDDVCYAGGFSEKYFTVFPWLLNYAKTKGTNENKQYVLWYYKWVIMVMYHFPTVTMQQITATLEDFRKRYIEFGSNEKVYHDYATDIYLCTGQFDKSRYHYSRWKRFKNRDNMDDCIACVLNRDIAFQLKLGSFEEALRLAAPILTGKKKCTHIPKETYTNLILPALSNNRADLAADYAAKLEKLISGKKYGDNHHNAHVLILYYNRLGQLSKSIRLFERYIGMAMAQKSPYNKFFFYLAAVHLFRQLKKETIRLKLPKSFVLNKPDSVYEISALENWFNTEASGIALAYNKRNGNDFMSDEMNALLAT